MGVFVDVSVGVFVCELLVVAVQHLSWFWSLSKLACSCRLHCHLAYPWSIFRMPTGVFVCELLVVAVAVFVAVLVAVEVGVFV